MDSCDRGRRDAVCSKISTAEAIRSKCEGIKAKLADSKVIPPESDGNWYDQSDLIVASAAALAKRPHRYRIGCTGASCLPG
jgi:hypothetical protein